MRDKEFQIILKEVKEWFERINKEAQLSLLKFEQVINNDKCFKFFFENHSCIGEVIVEQPEFAPYRFVKIEILSSREVDNNPIFTWYDKKNDDCEYIISQLQKGLNYALDYC